MVCRGPSTDPRHARRCAKPTSLALAVTLAVLALVLPARAHEPSRVNTREIVRMSGWFGTPPAGTTVARDVTLTVQGKQRQLHAAEWQVFALVSDQSETIAPAPDALTLQGTRDVLARIAGARGEQRVSILAERRPGGGEIFVLALDLCPEK